MHLQKSVALIPVNIASIFRPVQRIKKMCLAFEVTVISKDGPGNATGRHTN
jgi:hypothetical protein